MSKAEELERRVLERLLKFCRERELIGPHHFNDHSVQIIVDSEYQTFTSHQAVRHLLARLEDAGLADEFYETIST